MSMLQLLCSIVREWIKGAPSLCLVLRKFKVFYTPCALLLAFRTGWNQHVCQ